MLLSAGCSAAGRGGPCFPQPGVLLLEAAVREEGQVARLASWCSRSSSALRVHEGLCKTRLGRCGPARAPVHPRASLCVPCRWAAGKKTGQERTSFTIDHAKGELCEASCVPAAGRTAQHFSHEVPPAPGAAGSRCLHPRYPGWGAVGHGASAADRRSRCEAGGEPAAATSPAPRTDGAADSGSSAGRCTASPCRTGEPRDACRSSASRCQGRAVLGPAGRDGSEVGARGMGAACEDVPAPSAPMPVPALGRAVRDGNRPPPVEAAPGRHCCCLTRFECL